MKQRITYLVRNPDTFTPEKLEVKDGSLTLDAVEAVKEHQLTFSLEELPGEFRDIVAHFSTLHLKWASTQPQSPIPPFTSRVTPGLHILFSLRKAISEDAFCYLLHASFGEELKCSFAGKTSTSLIYASEAPNPDASSQYYSYLPSLDRLTSYIRAGICSPLSKTCVGAANSLLTASYLDIDYNSHAENLIITAFYDSPPTGWTDHIPTPRGAHTTEVGVLIHEPNPDPEDIAFGGFLTVLGQDPAPKPTRFQTPTLHYPLPNKDATYAARFEKPTGLHPTLVLSFPSAALVPPDETCSLYTHLTLPSYLFIDRYQFSDPLFLRAHNLHALVNISGATDLEAPDWVVPQWGSVSLFEMAYPDKGTGSKEAKWEVSIPMHLRYLPATAASHTRVPVPWPVVFWACSAEQDASGNPFDRKNLGYEKALGEGVRFMHVPPEERGNGTGDLVEWIDVPVLDRRAAGWVETGTIGVVLVAFLVLCWVLFAGAKKAGEEERKKKQ